MGNDENYAWGGRITKGAMNKKAQISIPSVQTPTLPITDLLLMQQLQKGVISHSVSASAPGKLMLLGEHAVVYGQPCIVTAVDQRITVTIAPSERFELLTPGVKDSRFVTAAVDLFLARFPKDKRFKLLTSEVGFNFGLGSSSAVIVATIAVLAAFFEISLSKKELFDLAYTVVLEIQGKGSGFDVAAAVYGGTLYYTIGGEILEVLPLKHLPLVIGYSGVKADTVTLMNQVAEKFTAYPEKKDQLMEEIGKLVIEAKERMLEAGWERVGKLMDFNQEYLRDLGVSTEKLEDMILAAKKAGAYGAKLSGAGGGDCMIALVSEERRKNVASAIESVGGQVIDVSVNTEGVKIEP